MNKKVTIVKLLIDESSSMSSVRDAVIKGFNEYLDGLKKDYADNPQNGEYLLSLTTFASGSRNEALIKPHFELKPLAQVEYLTEQTYRPGGGTPLYDAIGKSINDLKEKIAELEAANPTRQGGNAVTAFFQKKQGITPPDTFEYKAMFVIQTDGEETSSTKYTKAQVKELIQGLETVGNWTVVYLGVGLDAMTDGQSLGVGAGNVYSYAKAAGAGGSSRLGASYRAVMANSASLRNNADVFKVDNIAECIESEVGNWQEDEEEAEDPTVKWTESLLKSTTLSNSAGTASDPVLTDSQPDLNSTSSASE